jgi:leucyl aminopeptidase
MNFKKVVTPFINFQVLSKSNKSKANNYASHFDGYVYVFGADDLKKSKTLLKDIIENESLPYQEMNLLKSEQKMIHFVGVRGPTWIIFETGYGSLRDRAGVLATQFRTQKLKNIFIEVHNMDEDDLLGMATGFELSMYNYLQVFKNETTYQLGITLSFVDQAARLKQGADFIELAQKNAAAVQIARHMVNLPPNIIHPESIEKTIIKDLDFSKNTQIEVWDTARCKKEGLNLLVAVGQGAPHTARLIHLKYRPSGGTKKKTVKPIAFVGKGITFDTGGLDIKPSGAMRLMKKDMGGAAAVLGLAYWVDQTEFEKPCDFYLALAENSVDANAMRPSDVYKSHAGHLVEIDNTDAEGRLVLADAMSVAATAKESPSAIIDVATLTGAIKVALGAEVAGLFSNNDELADSLFEAGDMAFEPNWRMPLVQKYWSSLNSNFADFKNSGEGFGGAITAALFLEKFCHGIPWAHLDIYAWTDRADGALSSAGGNGQPVQTLIAYLENLK